MPYADPEVAKAKARERYARNKDLWRNPDGSWKQGGTPEGRRRARKKHYERNKDRISEARKRATKAKERVGQCPICLRDDQKLVYDHDHTTGAYRGHICSACNLVLGHAYDTPDTLVRAAHYLTNSL